ncbi:hypothetical protein FA95DRAFT_1563715 [Auriscalpium vulgare]|uniref:Uncharacterized protein n=1 Tax=Auriscalpium vulgare TaxID=40419 RepID=A0ACB8RFN8_9AGAM|nr:hypothetical protein FA95DRAFT_1563715 [Auriscalpium vulgare]
MRATSVYQPLIERNVGSIGRARKRIAPNIAENIDALDVGAELEQRDSVDAVRWVDPWTAKLEIDGCDVFSKAWAGADGGLVSP